MVGEKYTLSNFRTYSLMFYNLSRSFVKLFLSVNAPANPRR